MYVILTKSFASLFILFCIDSHTVLLYFVLIQQVVELKVGLHCEECIRKILKAIKKIEGISFSCLMNCNFACVCLSNLSWFADVETYNVDTQLNKVIVTGNVTTEEVIRVLQKNGKSASTWEEAQLSC